jgi:tRNA-2-methylthio-N6-dimethylallyladenosine synthase
MKTFYIRTFGCQMNEHDSDCLALLLEQAGLIPVDKPGRADLIIINSCSVRAKPEHKALSEAGRFQLLRRRRGTRVLLAGCVAQQQGRELLERVGWLDGVIGPDAVARIADIAGRLARGERVIDVEEHTRERPDFVARPVRSGGPTALVTIMKGCNNFCSYCVVPLVRGREVSRPHRDILREVEELARAGCREVTLLGQNVNSYRDGEGVTFPGLLRLLDGQGAVERIRFTTSHPRDVDDEMIRVLAGCRRVCEHVHLGLQSGSDRILKAMNRGYSAGHFLERVQSLRRNVPGVAVTTDIIVGFCGEREEDFQATLDVVEKARFEQAFSFKYSPRPGTAAARLADDVPAEVKAQRLDRLQKLLDDIERAGLERLTGGRQQVLVEGASIRDSENYRGRTRTGRVVNFSADSALSPGDLVEVAILEVRGHTLWGRSGQLLDKATPPE